jgi:hypothetical protein
MRERQYLTTAEASELYPIKKRTFEYWRQQGEGPPYARIPKDSKKGRIVYKVADIEAWIDAHKVLTADCDDDFKDS